jgi:hypothetical protein
MLGGSSYCGIHLMLWDFSFVHELLCMCLEVMSWLDFVRNKYMSVGVHATNEIATT